MSVHLTPRSPAIRQYYARRQELDSQGVTHELAVREAFKTLLEQAAAAQKWTLVIEQKIEGLARTFITLYLEQYL